MGNNCYTKSVSARTLPGRRIGGEALETSVISEAEVERRIVLEESSSPLVAVECAEGGVPGLVHDGLIGGGGGDVAGAQGVARVAARLLGVRLANLAKEAK